MTQNIEVELRFLVPPASRAPLAAEMARASASLERLSLAAIYLDTDDRRLARAGIAWRLRREGRRWIQTLKASGAGVLERFEHEVVRPQAVHDALLHAGTPVGDKLISLLRRAQGDGVEVGVRFQTEVRRVARRVRTRGAVVEVAFDQGRLLAGGATQRICEVEFERVSGSVGAMLALVERWRKRFGLIHDPRSKAERGDRLANGLPHPALRKAVDPVYGKDASATEAFGVVIDECTAQISRNAIGLSEGDPALRVEHVHQLRVGIRRLRSALRSFEGWAPSPPADLVDGLRVLFATLGQARDGDVLGSGVAAHLAAVGAPPLALPSGASGPDLAEAVMSARVQQTFLAWIAWRAALDEEPVVSPPAVASSDTAPEAPDGAAAPSPSNPLAAPAEAGDAPSLAPHVDAASFHRQIAKRLRRWHARIAADWDDYDRLDEARLHALRKRIKRQRYAVEFFTPVLRRRACARYLGALAAVQERMGELNDLFVARAQYQALVATEPAAWFGLGWLTARITEVRALARPRLKRLAKAKPPVR